MGLFRREPVLGGEECDMRLGIQGRWPNIKVTYGDHEIKGIRSLTLEMGAIDMPELTLRISPEEVDIDVETLISLEAHVMREPDAHLDPAASPTFPGVGSPKPGLTKSKPLPEPVPEPLPTHAAPRRFPSHDLDCQKNTADNGDASRFPCTCSPF